MPQLPGFRVRHSPDAPPAGGTAETTNQPAAGGAPQGQPPAAAAPQGQPGGDNSTIQEMRAQIERANQAAKDAQTELDKLKAAEKKRADAGLSETEREKKAREDAEVERDRLKADLAKRDMDAQRAKVGAKHKLPASVAALLPDGTEAEMEAKAAALAKDLQPPQAPNNNAGQGNNPAPAAGDGVRLGPNEANTTTQQQGRTGERPQTYRFQQPGDVPW